MHLGDLQCKKLGNNLGCNLEIIHRLILNFFLILFFPPPLLPQLSMLPVTQLRQLVINRS